MPALVAGTNAVKMDEPCFGLYELNLQSPGSRGWRRYQIIMVMRDDKPAEFRRDLGPAKNFAVQQLRLPGGARDETTGRFYVEHTVGELVDIADWYRAGMDKPPEIERRDLITGYHQKLDTDRKQRRKQSAFGKFIRIQRG